MTAARQEDHDEAFVGQLQRRWLIVALVIVIIGVALIALLIWGLTVGTEPERQDVLRAATISRP